MPDSNKVELKIKEANNKLIKVFKPKAKEIGERLPIKKGFQRFIWNMRYPDAESFEGMILWNRGGLSGQLALPNIYKAVLINDKDSIEVPFTIVKDPRTTSSQKDLEAQFNFVAEGKEKLSETHKAIKQIRTIRKQLKDIDDKLKDSKNTEEAIKCSGDIIKKITSIEENLYQTKSKSSQDVLNFPIRLNDKLAAVVSDAAQGTFKPTEQLYKVKELLVIQIDTQLATLKECLQKDIPKLNMLIEEAKIPAVIVK